MDRQNQSTKGEKQNKKRTNEDALHEPSIMRPCWAANRREWGKLLTNLEPIAKNPRPEPYRDCPRNRVHAYEYEQYEQQRKDSHYILATEHMEAAAAHSCRVVPFLEPLLLSL
jgi:hypothetical protein